MYAAPEVQLETGQTLLVTDADDSFSWRTAEQLGWGLGLYEAGDPAAEGARRFVSTEASSVEALVGLIRDLLLPPERPTASE